MPDKIDVLFDDLQSRGYAKDKTRKQFRDYMLAPGKQGYENRKTFLRDFQSNGETNLKTYEQFRDLLGLKAVTPQRKQQASAMIGGKATQPGYGDGSILKRQPKTAVEMLEQNKPQQFEASYDVPVGDGKTVKRKVNDDIKMIANRQLEPMKQQFVDKNGNVVKEQEVYPLENPELSYERALNQSVAASDLERQSRERLAEIEREENALKKKQSLGDSFFMQALANGITNTNSSMAAPGVMNQRAQAYNEYLKNRNPELEALAARKDLAKERIKLIEDAKKDMGIFADGEGLSGVVRNATLGPIRAFQKTKEKVLDPKTWDFGATDANTQMAILDAVTKLGSGEQLSKNEQKLLDDWALTAAVNSHYGDQLSGWTKAAMVTGDSFPYMLEMGFSPFSRLGGAAQRELMRFAEKKYGKKVVEGFMKRQVANKITKGAGLLGRVGGDALGADLMATTSGSARVAGDTARRMSGDVKSDVKDGNVVFAGTENGETAGDAIFKSIKSQAIEDWSEMAGQYFGFVNNAVGKLIGKSVVGKAGRKALATTGNIDNVSLGKAQRFIYDLTARKGVGAFSEGLDQFLKKTKWDGVFGEYAEEVLGNMANAITVGDQTLDTKEGTGVFNLEQNIDTFCGVALLGGFMSAVNTGGYAWHKFKNNPDRVSNENSKIIDNWQAVKTSIDNAADDPREINDLLTDLIRTPDQYDDKQKKAILKYTASVMEERGQEMAAYKPRVESMTTEQSTTESADGNSTVPTFVVSTFDKNGNEIEKQTFYSEEDADAYKTQTKMEQQKQDYDEYLNMAGKLNQQETETVIDTFLKEHGYDEADDSEKSIMLQDINDSKTPLGKEFRDYKNEKSVEKAQSSMDAIRQFEEDNGWEEGTVRYLSERDPMKMSEEELQMADQAREFLKTLSYPSSVVHPEISAREGSETADQVVENVVSPVEPINPEDNPGKDIVDSYVSAEKERNALFDNNENLKEEVEMMEAGGLSPQEIISSLDTFSDAQKQVLINYYNAQARYDSYMLQAENKINEVAAQGRQKRTFAGTINGQEDKANIIGITDGTNTYTLISGDISTSPEGNVTGSESGMLLALDENGEIVQLGESSNYTVLPTEMTLDEWEAQEVTRLQQEVSMVSDPNMSLAQTEQTQDKPQEEQADVEAGGENTGADEASATPTATERIPVDEEGNPVYEKAAPEDVYDSLTEQVGDMTPTIIKSQLDAAKKRLEKLVKDKEAGKLKGKTIQEQVAEVKELQEKINAEQELVNFWTKVMTVPSNRRLDEETKPKQEPTETTETVTNETPVEEKVPDWTVDKASDARARGYRMENGYRVDRQEPISNKVEGNDIEVKFDKNEEPVKGKLVVVESGSLIPSHVNGQRNVNFFINEAQPKERTDIDSDASSTRIAKKINPEEITAGVTAFTGSPVVNTRGEVIQGNNRTIGLQKMWNNYPDSQDKYKQYLIDHAEEFGLNKDEIVKMSSPVLVRMVDVPDEEAIRLGQKTASNTESGGKERIDPMRVIQQMGEQYRVFTNLLFSGEIEDQTLMSIISENGVKVLKWLNDSTSHPKYISDTQFQSCFDAKGSLTEEAKTDLRKIVENMLFQDAPESLSEMFYKMPAKAQNAILSTLWRDSQSEENDKIIKDIQSSIEAFAVINSASEEFRNAKDVNSARAAVKDLKKQTQMFGNTETVLEKFSNFALELAILYKGAKQNDIRGYFNTYYDGVQGKGGSLFETPEKKSKEQAIKDTYGIDINEKENGEEGNNTLESDNTNGESGEPNNEGEPGVGERVEEGEQPAVSGGGTETSGEVEAATEEQPVEEAVEEQPKEEEPFELTLEALEASDLDESVKSGARAWLNGEKTQANQFAFLIAQDYVRSIHGDTERGGTDADASQLGSEDNVSANGEAGRGNGESGQVDSADNGEGVPEVGIGGTDSTGNVAGSNGAGSDNGVSGQAPEQNGDSDTDGTLGSIGNRRKRRDGKSRGEGSGTTIPGGNAGRQTVASARAELDAALKEFEDALKESITEPLKGKLLAADPVSLYAFLGGAKAIKVLSAGTKVAYAAIKLGYYEFKDWVGMMKSKLGDPLRNIAGMSEEQIDGFIEMMWDYDLTVDGVTRKVSEWASVISDEALREQMGKTIEEKRKLQKEAEKTPTILGDITNIRESLPFLLTKQQEDVQKAERQFFDESHADVRHGHGKGYMFTNGTGTGKTYTGLGIVKRFLKQGKGRILIVTASETKINDWIKDAKNLGIEASMLPDTSSKGKGVVVTQFANIRQNRKLLEDVFDLIVYDESHKLMENQDGSATSTSRAHHMLSNRDVRQALRRELMAGEFGKAIEDAEVEIDLLNQAVSTPTTEWTKEIKDAYNKAGGNMDAVEDRIKELKELTERLEETIENEVDKLLADPEQVEKAREATKNTKVVFLSATPFNVPANMDYAEGYIFSYSNDDEVKKETDRLRDRDSFLVENFNSSHTRNPKTQVVSRISQERIPDPQKASEEEVVFSDKLQNDLETMSGRDLDSEYDYSREFPKMDFEMADKFNDAIQSLSDGRFDPLRKYFDHLLDDYTTMTGYLEIFKAQMIAPRIQQYIDLGKKVTLYHRRKASNSNMYPPFALAMQKARQEGDEKIDDAVEAFERAFESLFQWEQSIDYMFPQDSILREFMTDKEKETYKKETEEWTEQYGKKIVKLQGEVMDLNIQISLLENSGHKEKTPELLDQIKEKNKEIDKLMKKRPKPKCAVVSVFNGSETAKDRSEAIRKFNDDDSKTKVLVVQVQAGKEGISLHDTTGKYPRVQIGIFLPQSPIEFIQTEGRIFRVGNKSNAIFEYPLLGLDIELGNFAQKINGRSETTENLALGSRGRGLKDSISRAALASRKIDPSTATGIGGKELDSRQAQNADGFDEAMKNYSEWREEPKPTDINQIEVPDPIGYVMTKLARAENGERALVPNARRGSIARYMPMTTRLTAMEERNKDYARLSALIGGSGRKILNEPFADHSRVNKYDIVVLNTSHGENGEKDIYGQLLPLDTRDVLKACNHTDPSGRVVALVESEKVSEIKNVLKKSTTSVPVMEVKLPSFVLGKPSSILVIDNIEDRKKREAIISQELDLSQAKTEDNLFAQLRDMVVPERNIDVEGRIERKLRTTVTPFVNTGCIAKAKNYNTGKMEPDIRIQFGNMYVHFARGKMAWRTGYGRVFNSFVLRYGRIAQNETGYIQEAARNWVAIQRDLELDDEELLNTYRYYISNNKDRLGGVRDNLRIMAQAIEIALGKTPMQIKNIAEGKVENEVSGTYDLKGFRDVFNSLNNNDAELEALADKVFEAVDHIEGLKFGVLPGAAFRSGGGHNVVAHYVPSRNVIELNSDLFNAVRIKDSFKAQTVVHEMIHALTSWAIETYDNENTRGQLSPEQQEAVRTIKDVYSQINNDDFRRQLRLESELEDNAEYGLTNEHEMMAELSNPIFRKVLKAKKLWRQLINGVKMLLGIEIPNAESEETDALTALDNALETLMNTYDPTLYSSYIRNNEVVRNMEIMNPSDPMQAINDAAESWRNGVENEKSDRLLYKATALDKSANSSAEQPINDGGSHSSESKDNKNGNKFQEKERKERKINTSNPSEAIEKAAENWRESAKESESTLSEPLQIDESENKNVPLKRRTTNSYTDKDGVYHEGIKEELARLEKEIAEEGTDEAKDTTGRTAGNTRPGGEKEGVQGVREGRNSGGLSGRGRNEVRREASRLRAEIARREQEKQELSKKYNIDEKGNISLDDLSRLFHDLNSNKTLAKLFDKVAGVLKNLGVDFRFSDKLKGNVEGRSYTFFNATLYNWDSLVRDISDQHKATILLHEMIHNVASHIVDRYNNPEGQGGKLNKKQESIARDINAIYEAVRKADPKRKNGDEPYGLRDANEMIAELANPKFREILKGIEYNGRNIWQWLKSLYHKMFGLDNTLKSLSDALDDVLETYDGAGISEYKGQRAEIENATNVRGEDLIDTLEDLAYDEIGHASLVQDEDLIDRLEKEPKVKVYRAMQLHDGKLYPPMAAKVNGKWQDPLPIGRWSQADEHPELVDKNGKFTLDKGNGKEVKGVVYAPYMHGSTTMLNDQFKEAQSRPELVVVEAEMPESELTSNYQAEKSPRTTGRVPWKAGTIQGQLTGTRDVILSRWVKPTRIVPVEEVAENIKQMIDGQVEVMPTNVVTPQQREALEKLGVKFVKTDNKEVIQEGEHKGEQYSSAYGKKAKEKAKKAKDDPMEAIRIAASRYRKDRATSTGANPMSQSERAVYEERLDRVETVFSEAYQDSMISLKAGQNAIAHDKDIPDSQNAYMAENLMHGKNKVEMDMFNTMFRDPLIETINRIMEATGMNWGDIDRYVYTKSGLERNREFFVRDWLEKQRSKDEDVDDVEQGWKDTKENAYGKLMAGTITFPQYLEELDTFIRSLDEDYEPSEHDYSGFRAMFGEDYDEEEVINELMETENEIGEDVNELWDKVNACTKYGLERYRQSGLKSDAQIDNVEKMFHWYVPMRGFKEETNEDLYQYFTGKGKTKNYVGGLLKHAKGRGSEASYPISTIFSMTYKAISDCNQNLVNQKFYRLCQAHKNDLVVLSDAWIKLNEATGEWEEVWPDINDDMTEEEIRQATLDFEKNMNTLANVKKAQKIRGKANFPYKMLDKNKKNEHVVEVWMNGQKKLATVVGNPRMAQALNGQLRFEKGNNIFSKVNMWIKNQMASLFTSYSPTFALRNMMRDWTHFRTMLTVREGEKYAHAAGKYYAEQMPKMMTLFKKYREGTLGDSEMEQDFKDYMYQGGITGFVQMRKVDDIQNEMEKLNKQMKDGKVIKLNNKLWDYTLGAVEAFNEAIENNARFATYRASRHVAMRTKARSAYDAKEITVNFNRKGAGAKTFGFKGSDRVEHAAQAAGITAQILGEGRIFFNATIQAICTIFKNTQNPDGSLNIPYIKRLVTRYALPPFMFGFALPLINEALAGIYGDGDDDPYANLPEWTRRKNLCIYVGHNNFITIPVGQELAAFLSLGDMFAGMTYAPNLKPLDRTFAEDLADAFNTFSPIDIDTKITKGGITRDPLSEISGRTFSVLAPVVAVEQNLSWTGRPIYREDVYKNDKYTPEYQMVYSGTNPVLVEASRILHELGGGDDVTRGEMEVNPAIVQYLWEQYTGGPGKVFSNLISVGHDVKDVIEGRESDFNMRKIEGLKAFVQQGDDRTEFYRANAKYRKYREDAEKLYNDIKGYRQLSEKDPMAKIKMASKTRGVDYTRMQIVRKAEKYLSKMNKEANAAEGARKRELRRAVNEEIKSIVDVLDKVEEDK